MKTKIVLVASLLTYLIANSYGCGGYNLIVGPVQKCNDDNILYFKDASVALDGNCQMTIKGCLVATKPLKTASARYTIRKPPMPDIVGNINMCNLEKSKYKVVQYFIENGMKCPMTAKTICANGKKKIDLSNLKSKMSAGVGKTNIMFEVEHDTGKTCLKTTVEIKK